MKIELYSCDAPINEILKTPYLKSRKTINDVVLKDDCSILTPKIKLKSFDGFVGYNYVYLPSFQRYYYIVDVTCLTGGMIELSLKVDALFSFSKDLGNCIIQERRASSGQGSYIVDDKVIMNSSPQVEVIQGFGDMGFGNKSVLVNIACAGISFTDATERTGTATYTSETLNNVRNTLLARIGWIYNQDKRHYEGYCDCSSLLIKAFSDFGYTIYSGADYTKGINKYFKENGWLIDPEITTSPMGSSKVITNAYVGDIIIFSDSGTDEGINHVAWYDDNLKDPTHPMDYLIEAVSSQGGAIHDRVSRWAGSIWQIYKIGRIPYFNPLAPIPSP